MFYLLWFIKCLLFSWEWIFSGIFCIILGSLCGKYKSNFRNVFVLIVLILNLVDVVYLIVVYFKVWILIIVFYNICGLNMS